MNVGSNVIPIYLSDVEASEIHNEMLKIFKGMGLKDSVKKYPRLFELKHQLYSELYKDSEL